MRILNVTQVKATQFNQQQYFCLFCDGLFNELQSVYVFKIINDKNKMASSPHMCDKEEWLSSLNTALCFKVKLSFQTDQWAFQGN